MKISLASITVLLAHCCFTMALPTTQDHNEGLLLSLRDPGSSSRPGSPTRPSASINGEQARKVMQDGKEILENAARITLGPKGEYSVLDRCFGSSTITKDGVTIAKEIELNLKETLGAAIVKDAAAYTTAKGLASQEASKELKRLSAADQKAAKDCLSK